MLTTSYYVSGWFDRGGGGEKRRHLRTGSGLDKSRYVNSLKLRSLGHSCGCRTAKLDGLFRAGGVAVKNWKSREPSKRVPDARDLSRRRRRNFLRRAVKSSTGRRGDFLITVATFEILPPSFFE